MLDAGFLEIPLAHRGLHGAGRPENSLAAVRAAVDAGYGIEIDLQLSADGQAMVFHDDTLDRMTEHRGWLAEWGGKALTTVRLGQTQETIPTLPEVLSAVAGRVPLLIELKDQTAHPGGTLGPLEDRVAQDLDGYAGPVAVMSFHPGMVANLAGAAPDIPRGLTGENFAEDRLSQSENAFLSDYGAFRTTQSSFVSHNWRDLQMPSVKRLKAEGVPILCWTVRAKTEEAWARKLADNITFEGYLPA